MAGIVKARLIGPPAAVGHLEAVLAQLDPGLGVEVANVSQAYPSRGSTANVRVYIELLVTAGAALPATQPGGDRC